MSKGRFAARIRELVAGQAMPSGVIEPMLRAREALHSEYRALHGRAGHRPPGRDLPSAG